MIRKMLNFNDIELKQTRFYQDVFGEGRVEGEAAMLLCQLSRKFNPLPEAARQRIAAANAETLLVWGDRVLDAKCLEEVWAD